MESSRNHHQQKILKTYGKLPVNQHQITMICRSSDHHQIRSPLRPGSSTASTASRSERCGSGIWWEAGDGDVFIAKDAGAGDPSMWTANGCEAENFLRKTSFFDVEIEILLFKKSLDIDVLNVYSDWLQLDVYMFVLLINVDNSMY